MPKKNDKHFPFAGPVDQPLKSNILNSIQKWHFMMHENMHVNVTLSRYNRVRLYFYER